jgi:hypothetical protein
MADVVYQRGGADAEDQAVVNFRAGQAPQPVEDPARNMAGSKHVLEAGVVGAGIDQVRCSQLTNPSQALDLGGPENLNQRGVEGYVAPDGVANDDRAFASKTQQIT